jgi:glycosyltransferase involved in cell wall biosynthesis
MSFRVAVDARPVDIPFLRRRGIGRFAASLVPELAAVAAERGGELLLLRERGGNGGDFAPGGMRSGGARVVRLPRVPVPERVADLPDQLLLPVALRRQRPDVFGALSMYRLPLRPGVPAVVTMHDVIPLMRPDQLRTGIVHGLLYAAVRRARRVIAVSEAGRRDLVAHLGVPAEHVDVVYEAAAPQFVPTDLADVGKQLGVGEPYVLHVGGADPRKNLGALIDAFAAWAREHERPEMLVLAGPVREVERAALEAGVRAGEGRVRHLGFVADADLPALYSGARCLVMPSSYEGFGLPALEALACGTPVVASDREALPEVVDSPRIGRVFAGDEPAALAAALLEALELGADPATSAACRARAEQFSTGRCADAYVALYEEVIAGARQR